MHPTYNNIPRNIFQKLIAEVVKPEDVNLDTIKQHEKLNPLLWDENNKLRANVRKTLLENAKTFIKYSGVDNVKFEDIIITGSMANYNYSDVSDIDIHIILDFTQVSNDLELVSDLLKTKKKLWSKTYETEIKGHEIELYFQHFEEPHISTGVYSLIFNKWIKKPVKEVVDINTKNIQEKTVDFVNKIDDLEKLLNSDDFLDEYIKLKEKIKKYRKTGLEEEGEYSTENIVFKILRNGGYLNKFFNLKNEYLTKNLSINQ